MTGDERSREEYPANDVQDFLVPDLGEGLEDATITAGASPSETPSN